MERKEFIAMYSRVTNGSHIMSEAEIRERIHEHADPDKDMSICIGELSELILELTRHQCGKMEYADFLQELSHVQ